MRMKYESRLQLTIVQLLQHEYFHQETVASWKMDSENMQAAHSAA